MLLSQQLSLPSQQPQDLHHWPVLRLSGGSKSIVGFSMCSHSCSSLKQPPDHTRRLTASGETEEFASYQIFTVCVAILVLARGSEASGNLIMSPLKGFRLWEVEVVKVKFAATIGEAKRNASGG